MFTRYTRLPSPPRRFTAPSRSDVIGNHVYVDRIELHARRAIVGTARAARQRRQVNHDA
jgi:hypothetical protein